MIKALPRAISQDQLRDFIASDAGASIWRANRHLISTLPLELEQLSTVLALTRLFKDAQAHRMPPLAVLHDRTVATLFYENSTRTRSSFDLAARKAGATVLNLDVKTSSAAKGESLLDTATNLHAMGVDAIVMRHSQSGAPEELAREANLAITRTDKDAALSIINAGDGAHAHPSQGLLDLYTMLESMGRLPSIKDGKIIDAVSGETMKGKKVVILGDILHSRVARSNLHLLKKLGAEVYFAGPPTLVPETFAAKPFEAVIDHKLAPAIADAHFIITLRIQMERQEQGLISSVDEYRHLYRLDHERLKAAAKDVRVLHPGPINRGIEITDELADDPERSLILTQVTNGVLTRMAITTLLLARV